MTTTPEAGPRPVFDGFEARLAARLRPAVPPQRPLKIFQWAASLEDGTYLYRMKMPGEEMQRLGHEVQTSTRIGPWARDEADIIIGQRIMKQGPSILWQILCEGRRAEGRGGMVLEVDDDLWGLDRANPLAAPALHPVVQANLTASARSADMVTVSTEPLAAVVRRIRHDADPATVVVLPNTIRSGLLDLQRPEALRRRFSTRFGWQGSDTHDADWMVIRDAVVDVLQDDPTTMLRFLGTHHFETLPDRNRGGKIDYLPWTTDLDTHYQRVATFDASLAPLENTRFNRSKSALRVIETLALGVPVIASDVPSYRGWVDDGVTGFLVPASRRKWVAAMQALRDPELRAAMGAAGRAAAADWTIEKSIGRRIDAYRSLLPKA